MIALHRPSVVPAEVTHSSAQVRSEVTAWADWLDKAYHHPVGGPAINIVLILLASEMIAALAVAGWRLPAAARGKTVPEAFIRQLRNFVGLVFNLIFGALLVMAKYNLEPTGAALYGSFYAGGAFGLHLAWVGRDRVVAFLAFLGRFRTGFMSGFRNLKGGKHGH